MKYYVIGGGRSAEFPEDMLRSDFAKIQTKIQTAENGERVFYLIEGERCTTARWNSFGWSVIETAEQCARWDLPLAQDWKGAIYAIEGGGVMFAGKPAVDTYRAMVIRQALKACKIGMRVNRAYTPAATLKAAGQITGKAYKRGQYDAAIADISALLG